MESKTRPKQKEEETKKTLGILIYYEQNEHAKTIGN
jgi:hypothetical protein